MSNWHNQVVRITSVVKHPNADALDIVVTTAGEYPIVVRRDEYKPGDMAIYIAIDTIVPDDNRFYFLCPKKEGSGYPKYELGEVPARYRRIKAKKIRQEYSEGLLIQLDADIKQALSETGPQRYWGEQYLIGADVSKILHLEKWEEDDEENSDPISKEKVYSQDERKPDGWSLPYYDKDPLRKYLDCLLPDEIIVLTEKIHGANGAFCHDGESLWCKSRNNFKREYIDWTDRDGVAHRVESTDQWWNVARRLNLKEKLKAYPFLAIFGEVAGQVKGFRYDSKIVDGKIQPEFYAFDVYNVKTGRYFDYDDRVALIKELGLTPVPELYRGVWSDKDVMFDLAEGKTTTSGNHVREGFVLNTLKERFEPRLNSRMTVKLVGQGYNLNK